MAAGGHWELPEHTSQLCATQRIQFGCSEGTVLPVRDRKIHCTSTLLPQTPPQSASSYTAVIQLYLNRLWESKKEEEEKKSAPLYYIYYNVWVISFHIKNPIKTQIVQ